MRKLQRQLERAPAPLPDSAQRRTSPGSGFPPQLHLSSSQTGALARVPALNVRMDMCRIPILAFFITLLITFINCITASPSQAISNFTV